MHATQIQASSNKMLMPNKSSIHRRIFLYNKINNSFCSLQDKKKIYLRFVDFNVRNFQYLSKV